MGLTRVASAYLRSWYCFVPSGTSLRGLNVRVFPLGQIDALSDPSRTLNASSLTVQRKPTSSETSWKPEDERGRYSVRLEDGRWRLRTGKPVDSRPLRLIEHLRSRSLWTYLILSTPHFACLKVRSYDTYASEGPGSGTEDVSTSRKTMHTQKNDVETRQCDNWCYGYSLAGVYVHVHARWFNLW